MSSKPKLGGKNKPAKNAEREPNIQATNPNPAIAPTLSCTQLPPTHPHYEITCKPEKNWWDKFKPFIELGGLILLAIYTGYTIKMYWANKQAADAATKSAQAAENAVTQSATFFNSQTRPWIGLQGPVFVSSITVIDIHDAIELKTTIKNFGQSPGFKVIPGLDLIVGSRGSDIRPEIKKVCDHLEKDILPIPNIGEVLFPSDTHTFPTDVVAARAPRIDAGRIGNDPVYFFPGCIVYEDTAGKIHHTGICQWTDSTGLKTGTSFASCSRQYAD